MSTNSNKYHTYLAAYLSSQPNFFDGNEQKKPHIRKCAELPFQQTKAELWDEVTNTLCSLEFIQAKASAKMTFDLVNDFNAVLQVIPDNVENIRQEKERQARMNRYTRELIDHAKGKIKEVDIPETDPLWSEEKINAEIERIKTNPIRLDCLNDFKNFLGQEADNLNSYSYELPHFATQQAWNYTNDGVVGRNAEIGSPEIFNSLLLCSNSTRPLWNPRPQTINILNGHTSHVTALDITPNGEIAISGSNDNTCVVWDMHTGRMIHTLRGHTSSITAVAITPDGKRAISGSDDTTCIIWDNITGQALYTLKAHTHWIGSVSISKDGKMAISGSGNDYSRNNNYNCILWDLNSGKVLYDLKGHECEIIAVSFSPDNKKAFSCSCDNKFFIWDLNTGERIITLDEHANEFKSTKAVTFAPDGNKAFSIQIYYNSIVLNLENGKAVEHVLEGHTNEINCVAITPDCKRAITGSRDKTCIIWDLITGKAIKILNGHTSYVTAVAITPDGKKAISGSWDNTCIVWDLETGKSFNNPQNNTSPISAIALVPDGKMAISISEHNPSMVWDLVFGRPLNLQNVKPSSEVFAITQDGKTTVSCLNNKVLIVLNLTTGQEIRTLMEHPSHNISAVAITPDNNRIVSYSTDGTYIIWAMNTGQKIYEIKRHYSEVFAIFITPNGKRALSCSIDNTCIIWEINTGRILHTLKGFASSTSEIAFTPDGKRAISLSHYDVIIWDLDSGQRIYTMEDAPRDNIHWWGSYFLSSVAITQDGRKAITGSETGTSLVWNLNTRQKISTLKGQSGIVYNVIAYQNDKRAITLSNDKTIVIWALENEKKLGIYITMGEQIVSVFPCGVIVGDRSGKISILFSKEIFSSCESIANVRQIWDFELQEFQPLSADCPLCGYRFAPPVSVLETIEAITKKVCLRPEQSPCLELPDEVWREPGLSGNCPNCGGQLKFNPFFAGGEEEHASTIDQNSREVNKVDKQMPKWKFWKR
jgi:WD40 repeat protein